MKIEVFEEGSVLCDGAICSRWIETETTCENCPIDSLFRKVMEHNAEQCLRRTLEEIANRQARTNQKLNHEVHDNNRH